jgi:L-serine/L-threonine ammonia-lyase
VCAVLNPSETANQVCSIGGGGLYIGIVQGLQRHGLSHVPVIAVETIGADSMCAAVLQGQHITLPAITSIATTLGAKKIADKAWQLCNSHPTRCVTVTDAAAVRACRRFLDDHRVLVEPACGAALAAIYDGAPELRGLKCVVVIVCGGRTCTSAMLEEWAVKFGV